MTERFKTMLNSLIGRSYNYLGKTAIIKSFEDEPKTGKITMISTHEKLFLFPGEIERFKSRLLQVNEEPMILETKLDPKLLDVNYEVIDVPVSEIQTFPEEKQIITNTNELITMDIKETTDYSRFDFLIGNRKLNPRKITKIADDIKAGLNLLQYFPILVYSKDERFMIIDGQHRFEISKKIGSPIFFVECHELTLQQIAQLNSRGEKWSANDFLECYINLGIKDYIQLRSIVREFSLPITAAAELLMYFQPGSRVTDDFQSGNFKCKNLDKTRELLNVMRNLFGLTAFACDRKLITAIQKLQEKALCDFDRLKKKIDSAPSLLEKKGDHKKYLQLLETIYNHGNSKRITIY